MKKKIFNLVLLLSFALIFAMTIWAAVPPPPVNQEIGFFETRFNNLTEPECRACHNQNPPDGIPVNPTYLPDRHHLLVGTLIPTPTVVPNRDADGDGLNDTTFKCLNCHSMVWDGSAWVMDQNFRDCMSCHHQLYGDHHGWSPHHSTPLAQADKNNDGIRDTNANGEPLTYCSECHGSLVTDLGDGHSIPTYIPSLVTPWRSDKPNGDPTTVNSRGTQAGNCNFCHDSGTHTDGREIVYNLLSHHGAGFFGGYSGSGPCFWCHNINPVDNSIIKDAYSIRKCEGCHGVQSLHNIQVDSNAPANIGTIVPGQEYPYYGHIGSNDDCWGCHGFSSQTASAPYSGPMVPYITNVSQTVVNAGQDTILTIRGVAFTNNVQGPDGPITLTSNVILEAVDGTITTLIPDKITQSVMDVTIPFWINSGRYNLKAQKASQLSNRTVILLKPQTTINSAICNINGNITITGSAFVDYLKAVDSGTSVNGTFPVTTGKGKNMVVTNIIKTGEVISWTNTEIKAVFSSCPSTVGVSSVFGTASAAVSNGNENNRGKKK